MTNNQEDLAMKALTNPFECKVSDLIQAVEDINGGVFKAVINDGDTPKIAVVIIRDGTKEILDAIEAVERQLEKGE